MKKTILVIDTMGGLGDLVLALPMLHGLALSHTGAALHVVTTAPWDVLLERDPLLASVIPVEGRDEATTVATVRAALHRLHPDVAVTTSRLHGLPALLRAAVPEAVTDLWRSPPPDEPVDLRYVRLLIEEGLIDPAYESLPPSVIIGEDELIAARQVLARVVPVGAPVLLFPDSGMAVKHWSSRSWQHAVTGILIDGLVPVGVSQVSEQESSLRAAGAVVAPRFSIRQLAAFCAAAAERGGSAIGGDTGPVRLATAVGLPAVGLYGPTMAGRYGLTAGNINLQGLPGCTVRRPTAITEQACWWSGDCPLTPDASHACMDDITPKRALAALRALHGPALPPASAQVRDI
ncbi:glycosyltransferase family 9 protein [uncultured Amnibacterium sp.]|uniref:glycosyltransferase family 9 protein n=1 Tax=uncultured Amnibacterium sp. TaxID=1631851 RepID=UPI0035C9F11F